MSLDAEEIRNQSFDSVPKGYDRDQVDTFLERMAGEIERLQSKLDRAESDSGVVDKLASRLEELAADVRGGVAAAASGVARAASSPDTAPPPPIRSRPKPAAPRKGPVEGTPDEGLKPDPDAPSTANAGSDSAEARLVAMNLALGGASRDEVAKHLSGELGVSDPDPILEDVYSRIA